MQLPFFYEPTLTNNASLFTLSADSFKHSVLVLRMKVNDAMHLTNGMGLLCRAILVSADKKHAIVQIQSFQFFPKNEIVASIGISLLKNATRLEWFLEKATEIGIHEITPIICDHSERKVYKIDRAEKIIQAAMKQSLHYYIPKINEPISLSQFVKSNIDGQKFIAHCEETDKKSFKNEVKKDEKITILIGPEGDFSSKEINLTIENNFIPVTLGNTRLRTETAALVACHTIALINE